jgi:hypothetical protein
MSSFKECNEQKSISLLVKTVKPVNIKKNVSEAGLCLRPHAKAYSVWLNLQTLEQDRIWTKHNIKNRTMDNVERVNNCIYHRQQHLIHNLMVEIHVYVLLSSSIRSHFTKHLYKKIFMWFIIIYLLHLFCLFIYACCQHTRIFLS